MRTSPELAKVISLRPKGWAPKAIARALGMRPAAVAPLVREAAQHLATDAPPPKLLGCWASINWADGLSWSGHPEWHDLAVKQDDPPGLVCVLIARQHRVTGAIVAGYLVDPGCLGVKDALPARIMKEHEVISFACRYFASHEGKVTIPLELAQELVFGAVDYAQSLGFAPHPDFAAAQPLLGDWRGPSCMQFGYRGKPHYVAGPRDNVASIIHTLNQSANGSLAEGLQSGLLDATLFSRS